MAQALHETIEAAVLGESTPAMALSTMEDNRVAARAMAAQARRTIAIFTRDLDPPVYDDARFLEAVTRLATRSSRARVRVLVSDPSRAIGYGHRLIERGRRLTSVFEVRNPHSDYKEYPSAFFVADGCGVIFRQLAGRYEASCCFHAFAQARELTAFFDEVWERSAPDPEMRRLHI
ncbi:MAG: hypothetical protein GWO02_19865 [Gammaproteobacteria bacterium]|nr:hypothetical protein [Gammaproteobacteria bacterium]